MLGSGASRRQTRQAGLLAFGSCAPVRLPSRVVSGRWPVVSKEAFGSLAYCPLSTVHCPLPLVASEPRPGRLQRRPRAGLAPASLFVPFARLNSFALNEKPVE